MNIKEELLDLKRHFLPWFLLLFLLTVLFCSVGVTFKTTTLSPHFAASFPTFSSTAKSLSAQFFVKIKQDLLPRGVSLISTSPITVFLVQIKIALLGAFVALFPYLLFSLLDYLSPALFPKERRILFLFSISGATLFVAGMYFAYHFLVLSMFKVLFSFNTDLGVVPLLAIDEFISWTLASLFITGLLFLLPLFMYILTIARITTSKFWGGRWREAFVIFLIIASIITPDVSGVSVLLLSVPMVILYCMGIVLSALHERQRGKKVAELRVTSL